MRAAPGFAAAFFLGYLPGIWLGRGEVLEIGAQLAGWYLDKQSYPAFGPVLANLAAIPMQDSALPLLSGLVPILTVLAMELVFAWLCLRSIRLRKLLCGKPVLLIYNGEICQQNLRRTRINADELTATVVALPVREDIDFALQENMIVEFYSR